MKLLGKGNTAEVYEYAEGKACKLFYEGYPREYVELEFQNACEMYDCKIRITRPFQVISIGKRTGIIYEKIKGETLLKLMQREPEKSEEYLDLLVKLHQDMLKHYSEEILSYKEYLATMVKNKIAAPFRTAEFDIVYNEGISKTGDVLDLGVDYGVLEKSGAFFKYKGETLGQGREAVKKLFAEKPELLAEIEAQVRERAGI